MRGDDAIDYPEHLARDQRTAGEEKTQQVWKAEHPLAHRLMGKYLIYQKGCALGHATRPTARAESTSFATKSDQAFLVAFLAPYPQESVFKPPALQVVFEFPLHIARQYPAFLGQLALYFLITALSYNVFALMRQLLPGELAQHRAITIRWRLYAIAAKVVKTGRKRSNHDVLSMRINRLLNGVFLPRGTHSEPNIES